MLVVDLLIKGREIISNPENWTIGYLSIDAAGREVLPDNEKACAFCSIGAIERAYLQLCEGSISADTTRSNVLMAEKALRKVMGNYISVYNDSHTHAEVLAKWDEAINRLKGEQSETNRSFG